MLTVQDIEEVCLTKWFFFAEYYDEDEVYGHSYDDSYCVSPATGTVKLLTDW